MSNTPPNSSPNTPPDAEKAEKADKANRPADTAAITAPHEEPVPTQEESVPTDGRDTEGERMMKDVTNPKLHEAGTAEHKTPEKAQGGAKKA